MESLQQLLQETGLHETEAEIFLACHKYGRLSVGGITRYIRLPRTTLYGYVEKLIEKKFLITEKGARGNYYRAISPDELIALLKNKRVQYDEIIKKVETMKPAIAELASQNKYIPKIQYYEGEETIALLYERINKSKDRYFISDMDAIMDFMHWTPKQAAKEFNHTSGSSIEILLDTPRAREYAKIKKTLKKNKNYTYSIRFMDVNHEHVQSDTVLIDGTYFHVAYGDRLIGIEITNDIFYKTQKVFFDKLWAILK